MEKKIYLIGSIDPTIRTRLVVANNKEEALLYTAKKILEVNQVSDRHAIDHVLCGIKIEVTSNEVKTIPLLSQKEMEDQIKAITEENNIFRQKKIFEYIPKKTRGRPRKGTPK